MKQTMLLLLLLTTGIALNAQKVFQGTVIFDWQIKGENAELMADLLPKKMTMKYGEKSMITMLEGGMTSAVFSKIVINGERRDYFAVREDEKVVYVMDEEDLKTAEEQKMEVLEVTKVEGEKQVLGYPCQRYKAVVKQNGAEMVQHLWVTTAFKTPDIKGPSIQGTGNLLFVDKLPGVPLHIEVDVPGTNMSLSMTASRIQFEKIHAAEFERPKGFAVKKFSELMEGN